MKAWLEENNKNAEVFVSDPEKGYNDDMSGIDVLRFSRFPCLPKTMERRI